MSDWRSKPPTPKQIDYLAIFGLPVPRTAGEANAAIHAHYLTRTHNEAGHPEAPKRKVRT